MARADVKSWVQEFVDYFEDQRYADSLVENSLAMDPASKWSRRNTAQRVQAVVKTVVYQSVYLHVLALGQMAYDECRENTQHHSLAYTWDLIASYAIGGVEGERPGASDVGDGRLFWNQDNRYCSQFATCNEEGYARSNARLSDLLCAGRAESENGDCDDLKYTVGQIERTLLIPILQGILKYTIRNERRSHTSNSGDLAAGESLALSVLPIFALLQSQGGQAVGTQHDCESRYQTGTRRTGRGGAVLSSHRERNGYSVRRRGERRQRALVLR